MGLSFKWDITNNCNLRCQHCSVGKRYFDSGEKELSLAEKLEVVDKLADGGVKSLSLLGGEPLTRSQDIYPVINRASFKGIQTSLVTNGVLLDDRRLDLLASAGLAHLVISIDGPTATSNDVIRGVGTFDRVTKNVKNATTRVKRERIPLHINVNTVLNKNNFIEIENMVDLCLHLEVDEWTLLSLGYVGYAEDHLDDLSLTVEEEMDATKRVAQRVDPNFNDLGKLDFSPSFLYPLVREYVAVESGFLMPESSICCSAALTLGYIDPYGNLFPCDRIASNNYIGHAVHGAEIKRMNLLDHDFSEIWNCDYYMNMFDFIVDGETYRNYIPCNQCKYLKSLQCNPCPLYSLNESKVVIRSCIAAGRALKDIATTGEIAFAQPSEGYVELSTDALHKMEHRHPVRMNGIRTCYRGDYMVIFNPFTGKVAMLDTVGQEVWKLANGENTVRELTDHIVGIADEVLREVLSGSDTRPEYRFNLDSRVFPFIGSLHQDGFIKFE